MRVSISGGEHQSMQSPTSDFRRSAEAHCSQTNLTNVPTFERDPPHASCLDTSWAKCLHMPHATTQCEVWPTLCSHFFELDESYELITTRNTDANEVSVRVRSIELLAIANHHRQLPRFALFLRQLKLYNLLEMASHSPNGIWWENMAFRLPLRQPA